MIFIQECWNISVHYVSFFKPFRSSVEIGLKYSKHTRVTLTVQDGPGKETTRICYKELERIRM